MLHPRAELCENLGTSRSFTVMLGIGFLEPAQQGRDANWSAQPAAGPNGSVKTLSWGIWNNHRNRNYYLMNDEENCSGRVTLKNTGISSPDNFSSLVTSSLPDLFYYMTKYYLMWASIWLTKTRAPHIDKRAWRAPQSPSCGKFGSNLSACTTRSWNIS